MQNDGLGKAINCLCFAIAKKENYSSYFSKKPRFGDILFSE
jgi:hypothetical protein